MNYNTNNNSNNGYATNGGLGAPGAGFGARGSRTNSKRLSVALPPKVNPINEEQVDNPTPRTSRSHLLAGLRTQPKTPAAPASAPYGQTEHQLAGLGGYNGYGQGMPQTATGASFNIGTQHAMTAGRQTYSLPEQVLAPPSFYDQVDEMDPNVLQQMQMTSFYLAQRQQQLQQQLANITVAAGQFGNMNLNSASQQPWNAYQQSPMSPQSAQNAYGQSLQQVQSPVEVQPGVYLVYNPAIQKYSYVCDQNALQQGQPMMSPQSVTRFDTLSPASGDIHTPSVSVTPPPADKTNFSVGRSMSPPKKATSPPSMLEHVEPLPPPSATAFRRGHKKASSLAINPSAGSVPDGMKTSSAATFGSQRSVFPPTPMTGTFGPGAARAGEHPLRQPRGPPAIDELKSAPTSMHEGSKNFATRRRRRALDSLAKAGAFRRSVSRSNDASPASEREFNYSLSDEGEELDLVSGGSRKMSPIGSEMQEKRNSRGSSDGYFGLSSASSSEAEDGASKLPPTPATSVGGIAGLGGDRKKMLGGLLNAAEKRRSFVM